MKHQQSTSPNKKRAKHKRASTSPNVETKYTRRIAKPRDLDKVFRFSSLQDVVENAAEHVRQSRDNGSLNVCHLLCEECERQEAVCLCETCNEVLCTKCVCIIHPRTADGNEHTHLATLCVRGLLNGDASGALEASRAGSIGLEPAGRIFAPDGLELTEDDLKAAGCDLGQPTTLEAPKINLCMGDLDRSPQSRMFRAGQVVIFVRQADDCCMAEEDSTMPPFRKQCEGWGIIHRVPNRTLREKEHPGIPAITNAAGEALYQIRCFQSPVSSDYSVEARAAFLEETANTKATTEAYKRRAGVYDAAIMGFLAVKHRIDQYRYETIEPAKEAPVVFVPEGDIYHPADRRELLLESRLRACRSVLEAVDRRIARDLVRSRFNSFSTIVAFETCRQKHLASRCIARAWKSKQLRELDCTMQRVIHGQVVARRYGFKKRRFQPLLFLTEDEKRAYYTIDHRIYFRTRVELDEYAKALRDTGNTVYAKMIARAAANKRLGFYMWRDAWIAAAEIEKAGIVHVASSEATNTLAEPVGESHSTSPSPPWHPAMGIKLPALPRLWSKRGPTGRHIEDSSKFHSLRVSMQGPTDASNWVVPGLLLMGPYPSGPAQLSGNENDASGTGVALIQAGVSLFVNLCPAKEAGAYERAMGLPWKRLADEGRKLIHAAVTPSSANLTVEDRNAEASSIALSENSHSENVEELSDVAYAMHAALKKVFVKLNAALARAESALSLARHDVKVCPRYGKGDLRHDEAERKFHIALAKERKTIHDAESARRALNRLPANIEMLHLAISDDDCGDDVDMLQLCEKVEASMRTGATVYIYSRLGHGRAGMLGALLLGRLYGIPAVEALDRIQIYHDARCAFMNRSKEWKGLQSSFDSCSPKGVRCRVISCPQSMRQTAAVHRLLTHTDTIFSEHCLKACWHSQMRFQMRERGCGGVPRALKSTTKPQDKWNLLTYSTTHYDRIGDQTGDATPSCDFAAYSSGYRLPAMHQRLRDAAAKVREEFNVPVDKLMRPSVIEVSTMRSLRPFCTRSEVLEPLVTMQLRPGNSVHFL